MFLNKLNEKERQAMLDLAYLVANTDGKYAEEEKMMMADYKYEMQLKSNPSVRELSSILADFQKSTEAVKKIVVLEIAGLINADNSIEVTEKTVLRKIVEAFGLPGNTGDESLSIIAELNPVLIKALSFVG